jgi:hypothetical protein
MSTILPLRRDEAMTFTITILDLLTAGAGVSGRTIPIFSADASLSRRSSG